MVLAGIMLVMLLESFWPLRPVSPAPLARWCNNLLLSALSFTTLFVLGPLLSVLVSLLPGFQEAGLLQRLALGPVASFAVLLLSLELVTYWFHRASHALPLLWRIHAVHHSDTEVDATTAHRHHPLEAIASALVGLPVLVWLGPSLDVLLAYNVLHASVTVLSHGNVTTAPWLDRALRLLLVTPNFHRMHHSTEQRYTDSNYATLLPVFDHLFRTASQGTAEQNRTMPLGLAYFREPRYARLGRLLALPFLSHFRRSD